ncbi:MAG: hypothetical protein ACQEXJ_03955 [Myxococcota bacterium]
MNCALHTDQPATAVCCDCGNGVCATCRNKMFGRNYCDACAMRLEEKMLARNDTPRTEVVVQQRLGPPATAGPGKSPAVAAALSVVFPGAGQLYCGRTGRGIGVFIGTVVLTPVFIGWLLWFAQIFDAMNIAKEHNREQGLLPPF